tara:strand:- start:108 stop:446 length:339 start_codon:yes stop_codon:yes gene_type:complete
MPYKDKNSKAARESASRRQKKYYEKTREEQLAKNKTDPQRIKSGRINNWKRRGVKGDLNELYEIYIGTLKCQCCEYIFTCDKNKCLDHNHETGEFRKILCRNCNNFDKFLEK